MNESKILEDLKEVDFENYPQKELNKLLNIVKEKKFYKIAKFLISEKIILTNN